MSKSVAPGNRRTAPKTTTHSKDDAVDSITYERMLRNTRDLDEYYALQTEFIFLVCGRLGLRRGELGHMTEEWIDWRQRRIVIPAHEPCTNGRGGSTCGDCKNLAQQRVDHDADGLTFERAVADQWVPKTPAAVREVPFAPMPRVEAVIEEFFDRFDEWPQSCQAINRRVTKIAELTQGVDPEAIYPHALRASAATYWAGRSISVFALQQLLGWADLQTARQYVAASPENTERALFFAQS